MYMYDSIRFPSKFGLVPSTSPLIYDVFFFFILFVCLLVCLNAFDYFKIKQTSTGFKGKEKKDPDFLSLRPPPLYNGQATLHRRKRQSDSRWIFFSIAREKMFKLNWLFLFVVAKPQNKLKASFFPTTHPITYFTYNLSWILMLLLLTCGMPSSHQPRPCILQS